MFSTIQIRLLSAQTLNPELFTHVTLHLDGHDTRATYEGKASAEMYSYKLKKSGLRTQVCMDVNSMALWVSKSQPCKNHQDGQMLVDMKMHNKMHEVDCLALDGGYTQYLKTLVEETDLRRSNFAHPIHKRKLKDLTAQESNYNGIFGSFRSQMESLEGFDYPVANKILEQPMDDTPVAELLEGGDSLAKLQAAFLDMSMMEVDDEELPATNKREIMVSVEIPVYKKR
ncbi:hypothetical protein BGZ83_003913 [Gryganskiella cystojenkinii]|nr:hypothetical protein BGZ83_003913 [Gryganskiella cystojenkinii]